MAVLPLAVSLLLASISIDFQLDGLYGSTPLTLLSPTRNLTLIVKGASLYADHVPVSHFQIGRPFSLTIACISETSLHFSGGNTSSLVHSPSLCSSAKGILIDEASLHGCVSNVYQGSALLASKICSAPQKPVETAVTRANQPVYIAEILEVNEGGSTPLQWKNVYVLPEQSRLNISNQDIIFSIVENPQHGLLLYDGKPCSSFHYGHLLSRSIIYSHDGSETTHDALDFQLEINSKLIDFPWLETATYTLNIRINPVNDAPDLSEPKGGQVLKISAKGSRVLTSEQILLSDPDDGPDKVKVQVVESRGVHVRVFNRTVKEFTQRQLINRAVYIQDENIFEKGLLRLVARDGDQRSQVVTLHTVSTPIEVRMKLNTGIRLLHHTFATITNGNLSFSTSVPDLPLSYSLVGLPEHGVIECSIDEGPFSLCSRFTQVQIDKELVRFRHSNSHHPTQDMFSFQVEAGDFVSMIHNFRIIFIPMNVKVFNREVFILNGTETGTLTRSNLFAWTFPKSYSPEKLVYHIEEPPKYGILSRKLGKKNRRIGVSSNFTQEDLDNGLISYKLHFIQYSIVNDYFLFRVISPAVTSESLRFEIIFVPMESSIQLVNRTIIVQEGAEVAITSDFLSLTTPDDRHFIFTIVIPPSHGSIFLKRANGDSMALTGGTNFTTRDIAEGRLFYAHSGTETKTDNCYVVADSAFKSGRRIPLWMTFSVILINDNLPILKGDQAVQIVERGERVLYPHLLNWVDLDTNSTPLKFTFDHLTKDAAVLSVVSPYLPVTSFTTTELKNGKVMLRHLGQKNNFSIPYRVSDGKYTVESEMQIIASEPFIQFRNAALEYCCLPGDTPEIFVSSSNISVVTNLDVPPSNIIFTAHCNCFLLTQGSAKSIVSNFTQQDLDDGRVIYRIRGVERELITVSLGDRKVDAQLTLSRRSLGSSLELRRLSPLSVSITSAIIIDAQHLEQSDGVTSSESLKYHIIRQPHEGNLFVEKDGDSPRAQFVSLFSQQDINLGRLQYLHGSTGSGRDSFEFNISSPHVMKGPYTMFINIIDHHVSMTTSNFSVVDGSSVVISSSIINISCSNNDDYIVHIKEQPMHGWIVTDPWNVNNISSLESFTGAELRERRILYVSRSGSSAGSDSFMVKACISPQTCTTPKMVSVHLMLRNIQSPNLLRNEVLRVNSDRTLITNAHLDTEDPDTPAGNVYYLISRPSNGDIVNMDDINVKIFNFSQKDVDDSKIFFVKSANSSGSGGFSFLISDGVHQFGPEWFSIESWSSSSPLLEANAKLLAAPQSATIIGVDLLRVNLPNTKPEEILFAITKMPKFGIVKVDGIESDKFTQHQINRKLVVYSSVGKRQSEWTQRDYFTFVVQRNATAQPIEQEFRFRISSTYASMTAETINNLIKTSPLVLSKGGSSAINISHISLESLARRVDKEVLLLELGKAPRYGTFEWMNDRKVVTWQEFKTGLTAIYTHMGDERKHDSVMLYVYPKSESTRRSSRIRVTVPIQVSTIRDPLVQIIRFPSSVTVPVSGSVTLSSVHFDTRHPYVPPQSVVYEEIQPGANGISIQVDGVTKQLFSQDEVNRGVVTLVHTPPTTNSISNDAIIFSVEGHTRALLINIKSTDLALENHTVIEYLQGKTYILLNRTHLSASNLANRAQIHYKITSPPENGTFYWVAGEKEAKEFTQDDIDNGRILYAQLNMNSYKDSFEFVMSHDNREIIRNRTDIRVRPLVHVQSFMMESNSISQISTRQLNASLLQGSTPRFLVTSPPRYGRITLDLTSNYSALFFTFPDVLRSRVFYQAYYTSREVTENIELEVRADSVQPSRITLSITIIPTDVENGITEKDETTTNNNSIEVPRMAPVNQQIPVLILVVVLCLTFCILLCRKKKKKKQPLAPSTPCFPATPRDSLTEKPDLLGSTVFASVGKQEPRSPMKTFERPPPMATSPPTPHANTRTPSSRRRMQPSLDYAGLSTETPPPMPLFKQLSTHPVPSQHWV